MKETYGSEKLVGSQFWFCGSFGFCFVLFKWGWSSLYSPGWLWTHWELSPECWDQRHALPTPYLPQFLYPKMVVMGLLAFLWLENSDGCYTKNSTSVCLHYFPFYQPLQFAGAATDGITWTKWVLCGLGWERWSLYNLWQVELSH